MHRHKKTTTVMLMIAVMAMALVKRLAVVWRCISVCLCARERETRCVHAFVGVYTCLCVPVLNSQCDR